jgi:antitoxin component YwqK of YwqJK toxin-antitoxin module
MIFCLWPENLVRLRIASYFKTVAGDGMRAITLGIVLGLGLCTASCQRQRSNNEIVCETYVHKYGVEVAPEDWSNRGQNGTVIAVRKDGVTVSTTYAEGMLHGDTTHSYPHSKALERCQTYENNHLVAETTYYPSGEAQMTVSYLNDNERELACWYETGEPRSGERWHGNLLLDGEYYTIQQELEAEVHNGHGLHVLRNTLGDLISHEQYAEGECTSVTTFHSNGMPREITPKTHGKIDGVVQHFYADGSPESTEEWRAGLRHGLTTLYQNGVAISRTPYVNGRRQGVEEHGDGAGVSTRVTWLNDMRHGPTDRYVDGHVTREWFYCDEPVTAGNFALLNGYQSHRQQ